MGAGSCISGFRDPAEFLPFSVVRFRGTNHQQHSRQSLSSFASVSLQEEALDTPGDGAIFPSRSALSDSIAAFPHIPLSLCPGKALLLRDCEPSKAYPRTSEAHRATWNAVPGN